MSEKISLDSSAILYFIHQQTLLCLFRPAGFRNFILINPLTNHRMKVTKERLSYLKQAQYVQRLAEPYIRKGKLPLWKIHTKFVIEEAPVSLNTFRKMLKEDVSHLNEKIEIYRKQMEEQHDREVEKKRRKRIRSK